MSEKSEEEHNGKAGGLAKVHRREHRQQLMLQQLEEGGRRHTSPLLKSFSPRIERARDQLESRNLRTVASYATEIEHAKD